LKFDRRRAVSPIIASLLLIAIAVAAGILVYVYVNTLSGSLTGTQGQQVAQQAQLEAYGFTAIPTTGGGSAGTGQLIDFYLKNVGGTSITISSIYVDGNALTEWAPTAGSYLRYNVVPTSAQSCFMAIPTASTLATVTSVSTGTGGAASCTAGTATCAAAAFCLDTGAAQVETLTVNSQSANQIVVGLNQAAAVTAGTSHTIKVVTVSGGQAVFTVVAGRSG
jgi:flagellin-like protein